MFFFCERGVKFGIGLFLCGGEPHISGVSFSSSLPSGKRSFSFSPRDVPEERIGSCFGLLNSSVQFSYSLPRALLFTLSIIEER